MERWKQKIAIITGASAGIGAAIAEQLVNAEINVVGLARRKEKLDELRANLGGRPGKFYGIQADVTKEEDLLKAFEWVRQNLGPIHILINNAGIFRITRLIDGDTKLWREVLDTNVMGLCVATREAIKDMRANNADGHVIHMNSIGGHSVPNTPKMNVYAGSKHAVTALTETLRQELNAIGSRIKITSISPGVVETEIVESCMVASGINVRPSTLEGLKKRPSLLAEDIADAVYYVLGTPPHVQVHEIIIKPVGELI